MLLWRYATLEQFRMQSFCSSTNYDHLELLQDLVNKSCKGNQTQKYPEINITFYADLDPWESTLKCRLWPCKQWTAPQWPTAIHCQARWLERNSRTELRCIGETQWFRAKQVWPFFGKTVPVATSQLGIENFIALFSTGSIWNSALHHTQMALKRGNKGGMLMEMEANTVTLSSSTRKVASDLNNEWLKHYIVTEQRMYYCWNQLRFYRGYYSGSGASVEGLGSFPSSHEAYVYDVNDSPNHFSLIQKMIFTK